MCFTARVSHNPIHDMRWIEPVELVSELVTLEPLSRDHADALAEASRDGELWRLWYTSIPAPDGVADWIEQALTARECGEAMPFAVRHNPSDTVIGSSRYCHVDAANRRLEIGHTWYAKSHQRSALNSQCKLLLLQHAFETLDCIAVEFRTHWHNRQSRTAIARLGAKQDGVLRNHQLAAGGSYRDTVVFSIIESEWPAMKQNLSFQLQTRTG